MKQILSEIAVDRWIPVSEEPDEEYRMYLVTYQNTDGNGRPDPNGKRYVGMARFSRREGWLHLSGSRANDAFATVTHWRPLPATPED